MGIVTQSLLGDTLWHLGLADSATQILDEAVERGKKFSPFTYSIALVQRMAVSSSMRDHETTRQVATDLIALSEQYFFQYWTNHYTISLEVANIRPDSPPAEIEQHLHAAAAAVATNQNVHGSNLQCTRFLAWIVGACLEHGETALARQLLDRALLLTAEERYWESELRRLEGLVLKAEGASADDVKRCFTRGLESRVNRAPGPSSIALRLP